MIRSISLERHLLARARRLVRSFQFAAASQALQSVRSPEALHLRGYCELKQRHRGLAARLLRKAVRLRPDRASTHALLARADRESAVTHLRRASELSPGDARLKAAAGLALVRAGAHDDGLSLLREAFRMSGSLAVVRRLVKGLCEAGYPSEAEGVLQAARFAAPRCPTLLSLLGKVRACGCLPEVDDPAPVVLPFVREEGSPRHDAVPAVLPGPHTLRLRRGPALSKPS